MNTEQIEKRILALAHNMGLGKFVPSTPSTMYGVPYSTGFVRLATEKPLPDGTYGMIQVTPGEVQYWEHSCPLAYTSPHLRESCSYMDEEDLMNAMRRFGLPAVSPMWRGK